MSQGMRNFMGEDWTWVSCGRVHTIGKYLEEVCDRGILGIWGTNWNLCLSHRDIVFTRAVLLADSRQGRSCSAFWMEEDFSSKKGCPALGTDHSTLKEDVWKSTFCSQIWWCRWICLTSLAAIFQRALGNISSVIWHAISIYPVHSKEAVEAKCFVLFFVSFMCVHGKG